MSIKIKEVLSNPQAHIEKQHHILDAYMKRTWKEVAEAYVKIFKQKSNFLKEKYLCKRADEYN